MFLRSDSSAPLPSGLSNPKHTLERRISQDVVGAPGFVEKQTDKTPTLNGKNSYSSPLTLFLIILLKPGSSKKQKHSKTPLFRQHFLEKLQRLNAFNPLKISLFSDFISLATFSEWPCMYILLQARDLF